MTRFLVAYGPNPHTGCHSGARMVAAPKGEITEREIAYSRRLRACGPSTGPWDVTAEGRAS